MSIIKVKTGGITADAITDALIADDVVGTEHLTANEVDTTALGADAVTAAQIADDAISEEHLDVTAITGHTAETSIADGDTLLIHDASASALRKMTKANFVSGIGGTNTPSFLARNSTNRTLNDYALTQATFDTEYYDTANGFASNTYTIPSGQAGKYHIYLNLNAYDAGDSLIGLISYIYVNDTSVVEFVDDLDTQITTRINNGGSIVLDLSAGDTLKAYVRADTNDSSTVALVGAGEAQTYFGGYKLIE